MKAVYCSKYGAPEVLEVREIEKPSPKENEVLVKVKSASITTADSMIRRGIPFYGRFFLGLFRPKHPVMGTGFSGEVVEKGKQITQYKLGDFVVGETVLNFGANAEYVVIEEDGIIAVKPDNISFQQAAPICDGPLTSFNFLKNLGNIKKGDKVLVNGASGSLGTAAVQLAKHFGAIVTGVCSSSNIELVKSLGADEVINYKNQDFTKVQGRYDLVYDTIGTSSYSDCKRILKPKGIYMSPVLSMKLLYDMIRTSIMKKKRAKFSATGILKTSELKAMLKEITQLMQAEALKMVIDREYSMERVVEAHTYIDSGRKKGNIVLVINLENL